MNLPSTVDPCGIHGSFNASSSDLTIARLFSQPSQNAGLYCFTCIIVTRAGVEPASSTFKACHPAIRRPCSEEQSTRTLAIRVGQSSVCPTARFSAQSPTVDSNHSAPHYGCGARPSEHLRRRVPPGNRTPIASLEDWCPTIRPVRHSIIASGPDGVNPSPSR